MTVTSLNISFEDNLEEARLVRLGWNLCQNDRFDKNITDFCRNHDSAGDARFSRANVQNARGINALRCAIYSLPASETNVRHDVYIGPLTTGDKLHIGFDAWADAAKTIKVGAYNTIGGASASALSSISLTAYPKTYYAVVSSTATVNNAYISFILGGSATDVYLTNIRIYKEEESETIPRFQGVSIDQVSGSKAISSIDGKNETSRMISRGMSKVTITDPFVDSDPMFWENIVNDKGREWQEGIQYINGDNMEHPSGVWGTIGGSLSWESGLFIQGEKSLGLRSDTTTTGFVRMNRTVQENAPGEKISVSAWVTVESGTRTTGFITAYDGATHFGSNVTATDSAWIMKQNTDPMNDTTVNMQVFAYGIGSSAAKTYFDAMKIEKEYYSPFLRQPTAYLWGLYVKYTDGNYDYHCLVPRVRWGTMGSPMTSGFLAQTISGAGDQMLMARVAA